MLFGGARGGWRDAIIERARALAAITARFFAGENLFLLSRPFSLHSAITYR